MSLLENVNDLKNLLVKAQEFELAVQVREIEKWLHDKYYKGYQQEQYTPLTDILLYSLGFRGEGKDHAGRPAFRLKVQPYRGNYYSFEIQVVLSNYPPNNPNSGVLYLYNPPIKDAHCTIQEDEKDKADVILWENEQGRGGIKYIDVPEMCQPIAWHVCTLERLNAIYTALTGNPPLVPRPTIPTGGTETFSSLKNKNTMSLKSFLHKLWEGIRHFFAGLPHDIQVLCQDIVTLLQAVKGAEDAGLLDALNKFIPGHWSDELKSLTHQWLPDILIGMDLTDSTKSITDRYARAGEMLKQIRVASDDVKDMAWHAIGSKLLEKLNGGKITWSDSTAFAEMLYKALYGKDMPATQQPPVTDPAGNNAGSGQ